MPTPSSNPPPEFPPRSHSSTCPEEPRSWRPSEQERPNTAAISVRREVESPSPDPEPVSDPSPSDDMIEEDATTATMESRFNTESPRPHSRDGGGATPVSTAGTVETDTDDARSHHKPMEVEEGIATGGDPDTSSAPRPQQQQQRRHNVRSTGYNMLSHNDKPGDGLIQAGFWDDNYAPPIGYEYSNVRILPTSPSSFLRPGSRFHGTQQSERQVYDVQVEIKYVDFRESFLCGYLKIQGLTEDNPTLTTYFEGEIIGSKYGFLTQHPSWGATEKIDLNHWSKFTAFRQYKPAVRAAISSGSSRSGARATSPPPGTTTNVGAGAGPMVGNVAQRENIFMRWKEHFLVPDHRVRTINGASFEGFYYICFNQKKGDVHGIYFHSKSEKFQQLDLRHVDDRGCFAAMEFR
ncbi:hypothetical protein DL764_007971 [Monosporascus ibericus]|uniref:Vacuolar import and degradation protein n=1 Tax=Monosporascus ibericus TaxID=155417 RepID=A0A4Q4T0X6_9PEZI|nr:hypothetical protein DL764_007971 [Monosporascus ibericus]